MEVDLLTLGEDGEDANSVATMTATLSVDRVRGGKRGRRRKSIVEVTSDSGDTYFFDDPALGALETQHGM